MFYGGRIRVGILYRGSQRIESVKWLSDLSDDFVWPEGSVDEIREVIVRGSEAQARQDAQNEIEWDIDTSYLAYFYRCLQEGTEFYVLYEPGVGWKAGGTTWDTDLRGRLLPWSEAVEIMEEWWEDLKGLMEIGAATTAEEDGSDSGSGRGSRGSRDSYFEFP